MSKAKAPKATGRTTRKKPVAPAEVTVDFESLTWQQVEELEELTGKTMTTLLPDGEPGALALMGLIALELRKSDPEITIDDVRKMKVASSNLAAAPARPTRGSASKN